MQLPIIKHKGEIFSEIRPAYFMAAFGEEAHPMRIFSFGKCNFMCPFCKREGFDRTKENIIANSVMVPEDRLYFEIDKAIAAGYVVRFSGGDPCTFPDLCAELARYAKAKGGKVSIAHNGSSWPFVRSMRPYLDFAAIDCKAADPELFSERTKLPVLQSKLCIQSTIHCIQELSAHGIPVDVRVLMFSKDDVAQIKKIIHMLTLETNADNVFVTIRRGLDKERCLEQNEFQAYAAQALAGCDIKAGIRADWDGQNPFLYWNGFRFVPAAQLVSGRNTVLAG